MPRSFRNLFEPLIAWDNLLFAYRKCRKRKRFKRGAAEFDYAWESNLIQIQNELAERSYRFGTFRNFYITEPKLRKISAAPFRDRIVHHAIINILEPIWERTFIFDSFACRKNKGTHRAIRRAQYFARKFDYFVSSDIVKFFPNIDHTILNGIVARKIRDHRMMNLVNELVQSGKDVLKSESSKIYFPGDDLFAINRERGLPIGNLTSQFFANVYLDSLDHFVKEQLGIRGYVRYADDFVLFGNDKSEMWDLLNEIKTFLESLRLKLHGNKTVLGKSERGFDFLGFHIRPNERRLGQAGIRRFNRNLRRLKWQFKNGLIGTKELRRSLEAFKAHAKFGNTTGILNSMRDRIVFRRSNSDEC